MISTDLTTGSVFKKLIKFALPILGANLLQALYGTVDLLVVGQFSDAVSVSGVATGSMTLQTIMGIIFGLTTGCTVLMGHYIGAKNYNGAARTVASSFLLFVILGGVLTVVISVLAPWIASVMNAPAEAFGATVSYIRICGFGIIFIVLFNSISGLFRGMGDSKTPLILMGIACVMNIFGDLLFVGKFGMASSGAALATVIAQAVSVVSSFFIIRARGFGFKAERQNYRPAFVESGKILKYGTPIAAQEALTGVSFMIILAILNAFGLVASAGVGVGEKICAIMFIVPGAFIAAESAFSAQNIGAGDNRRALSGMLCGICFTVGIGLIMFLLGFFKGQTLASFFTTDVEVQKAAANYLKSYSLDCVLVGFSFCMMGYFNGRGKTLFVAIQGLLQTFLVRIPVSFFLSRIPGASLFLVGFATPLATVFGIILNVSYLVYLKGRESKLLPEDRSNQ